MSKEYYIVSMELGTQTETIETWPCGGSYDRNEAVAKAKEFQKDITDGKWDERKKDGCVLQMTVDTVDDDSQDLISIATI